MMKKLILLFGLVCSSGMFAWANQMQFVTTLSSPMGTFAALETADSSVVSSAPLVNFCNTRAPAGEITVKGADAYISVLALKNGTVLGGNTPEFRISSALGVNNNTTVTGGRLMANSASLSGASSAKSKVEESLYVASVKLKGAKTEALTIPGQVQTGAHGANTAGNEMRWSNEYKKDYRCTGSSCSESGGPYTAYLLKSGASSSGGGCSAGAWTSEKITDVTTYNNLLRNDCSSVSGRGGDPNYPYSDSDMSYLTAGCTDYETITRSYYETNAVQKTAGRNDQDTCNGDDRASYGCDGSKTSCVDIRVGGAPGYPRWAQQNTFFNCSNSWTQDINWNYSSIRQVPECGSAGNLPASNACSSFRTGPGGQDNFFCYKKPQSSYCSAGSGVSNAISVTYLKDCPAYVRYDITCTQKAKYRTREITCN